MLFVVNVQIYLHPKPEAQGILSGLGCGKFELLISTNGGRGKRHPEKETLAQAILVGNKVLYCNYDIPQQDILEKLQKKYGYKIVYAQRKIEV